MGVRVAAVQTPAIYRPCTICLATLGRARTSHSISHREHPERRTKAARLPPAASPPPPRSPDDRHPQHQQSGTAQRSHTHTHRRTSTNTRRERAHTHTHRQCNSHIHSCVPNSHCMLSEVCPCGTLRVLHVTRQRRRRRRRRRRRWGLAA